MAEAEALKKIPVMLTDEEAEHFVETADLTEYDLSDFKPMKVTIVEAPLDMRVPEYLLERVKAAAAARGVPVEAYVREVLEAAVAERQPA